MVQFSYTVANPRAMVIHPLDTFFTDRAVMNSLLFYYITFEAVTKFIEKLYLISTWK